MASAEVDMPTLMSKYFTIKVKRARRVQLGLWLIRLGCWLSGVPLEIVGYD